MKHLAMLSFLTALVVWAAPASAALLSFNIDFGNGPAPTAAYGGAASQPGVWNAVTGTLFSLTDIAGNLTNVKMTYPHAVTNGIFDHPGTSGDDEVLMDDFAEWSPSGPMFFYVKNLPAGDYKFFSYSFAPSGANSWVDITGSLEGFQLLGGGPWPGAHQAGLTYALHTLTLAQPGDVEILVGVWNGAWGGFNGLQIVQVPEPSSLVLLTLGGLALMRHRRVSGVRSMRCGKCVSVVGWLSIGVSPWPTPADPLERAGRLHHAHQHHHV